MTQNNSITDNKGYKLKIIDNKEKDNHQRISPLEYEHILDDGLATWQTLKQISASHSYTHLHSWPVHSVHYSLIYSVIFISPMYCQDESSQLVHLVIIKLLESYYPIE